MSLTSTDYIKAEQNGIKRGALLRRIQLGWDKETAITKPCKERKKWLKVALKKGMSEKTFDYRVYYKGLSYEESAKKPVRKYRRSKAI